jgi:hypothetical protein
MLQQLKDKERIIALQDEKIAQLELSLKSPPDRLKDIARISWDSFPAQLTTVTKLYLKSKALGRKIISYDTLVPMSEVTGYSIDELKKYWAIGEYFQDFNGHPINKIVTFESVNKLTQLSNQVLSAIDLIKSYIFSVPLTVYVDYVAKNQSIVKSVSLCKVDWNAKSVKSKTAFIKADEIV